MGYPRQQEVCRQGEEQKGPKVRRCFPQGEHDSPTLLYGSLIFSGSTKPMKTIRTRTTSSGVLAAALAARSLRGDQCMIICLRAMHLCSFCAISSVDAVVSISFGAELITDDCRNYPVGDRSYPKLLKKGGLQVSPLPDYYSRPEASSAEYRCPRVDSILMFTLDSTLLTSIISHGV